MRDQIVSKVVFICPNKGRPTAPRRFNFVYSREETMSGELLHEESEWRWGCSCCDPPETFDMEIDMCTEEEYFNE